MPQGLHEGESGQERDQQVVPGAECDEVPQLEEWIVEGRLCDAIQIGVGDRAEQAVWANLRVERIGERAADGCHVERDGWGEGQCKHGCLRDIGPNYFCAIVR